MKNKFKILLFTISLILPTLFSISPVYATKTSSINTMIEETAQNSKIPAISASTISNNTVNYYSHGKGINDNSLFYIGSLSKSFTSYGILYLKELNKLSLDDPITKHIPWFKVYYKGKNVANQITIQTLLSQKSGFTNSESKYPSATSEMTLKDGIESLNGKKLEFSPNKKYVYSNVNYNILGYIIEQVSGVSYQEFMTKNIFLPLGLTQTYASPKPVVSGARLSFNKVWNYNLKTSEGAIPAGYIISSSKDLNRWLQIQLGMVELSTTHLKAIKDSHKIDKTSVVGKNTYYSNGWFFNTKSKTRYHAGGTPNYSSYLVMDLKNHSAATVLTNMNSSVNTSDIANNMISILNGERKLVYQEDIWSIMDKIFSILIVITIIVDIIFFTILFRKKNSLSKRKYILPVFFILLTATCGILLPMVIFDSNWTTIYEWAPLSIVTSLAITGISGITMFLSALWVKRERKPSK